MTADLQLKLVQVELSLCKLRRNRVAMAPKGMNQNTLLLKLAVSFGAILVNICVIMTLSLLLVIHYLSRVKTVTSLSKHRTAKILPSDTPFTLGFVEAMAMPIIKTQKLFRACTFFKSGGSFFTNKPCWKID